MNMVPENGSPQGTIRGLGLIARALARNRLSHAYLVAGPPGSGKKRLIRECARLLLCENPRLEVPEPGACLACTSCLKFKRAVHPDFLELEPQGRFIRIDQIREMQRAVTFAPLEARRRVVVILTADRLNISASNALLKTLEEPPENTHLLLASTSSSRLLPTIVSRCQVLPAGYRSPDTSSMAGAGLPAAFLEYVSGQSMELRDQMLEDGLLDIRDALFEFLGASRKKELFFQTSRTLCQPRKRLNLALVVLHTVVRDLFLLHYAPIQTRELINQDRLSELSKLAQCLNYDSLVRYHEFLYRAETYVERNVNPEMISDALLVFWTRMK